MTTLPVEGWTDQSMTTLSGFFNVSSPLNATFPAAVSINLTDLASTDNNNTSALSSEDDDRIEAVVRVLVPICFGIIAVTGFFGNLLVILVVLLNKNMHSTTNLLIVNLAVADLLFVIFCVPFTAVDYVMQYWPFGRLWCRTVQYLICVTAYASIYTLVLMSIDRFLAVVHPIRSRQLRTEHITKIAICTLWTVVLTVSLPAIFAHNVLHDIKKNVTYASCQFIENEILDRRTFHTCFFVSSYLLPLMIISGLYVRMIMRLWRQGSGVRMSKESQRGRKRVTRLVVVVVIAFASLWLPVQLILVLKSLDAYHADTMFLVILQIVAHTLAYTSSCINPLLYAFLSDNFRKAFYKAINCSNRYQNYTSDLPPPRKTSCARTSTTGL
ncbi:allatostatin-A receptor isoform X2 [Scaptodrosophila lebanonensis]|uniref:Allatostatin-A receptor isoform X2 n=1 Tax=Drosophila lebanonensis TaxID=7225 RepID=A0A6J2T6X9_DROLE|nr:allatostatin-A receptor isoform X2 [Scaptodrosophila lebanonensis]